jgi:hypothetical protein
MPDHQLDVATATNYGLNILCHDTSLPGAADLHLVNLDILLAGMDKRSFQIKWIYRALNIAAAWHETRTVQA